MKKEKLSQKRVSLFWGGSGAGYCLSGLGGGPLLRGGHYAGQQLDGILTTVILSAVSAHSLPMLVGGVVRVFGPQIAQLECNVHSFRRNNTRFLFEKVDNEVR